MRKSCSRHSQEQLQLLDTNSLCVLLLPWFRNFTFYPSNLFCYLQVVLYQLKPGTRCHIRVLGHARLVGQQKKEKKRKEKSPGNIPSLHKLVDGVTKLLRASALCRDKARRFSQIRTRKKNHNKEQSVDVKIASVWKKFS